MVVDCERFSSLYSCGSLEAQELGKQMWLYSCLNSYGAPCVSDLMCFLCHYGVIWPLCYSCPVVHSCGN